ncbi:MAG: 50S ribosomal protein L25 [Myxococcales bacterium]|nr:50S ribosomal protein L25 [Myxococcales bacterium]
MEISKLTATTRTEFGKGPARRLRNAGQIPAVAYGKKLEATALAVDPKVLKTALSGPHGRNRVLSVEVQGGNTITALVREYAHHPVTRAILHADFIQVDLKEPVDVEVPFKVVGKAKGVVAGGELSQPFRVLPVRCLPEKIPVGIEADVTELGLNESFKTSQLKLPEGVSVRLPAEQTVVAVVAPDKRGEEEAAPAAAGAAPAAAAAGKAAPAAAAGKAAPAAAAAAKPAADKKKK